MTGEIAKVYRMNIMYALYKDHRCTGLYSRISSELSTGYPQAKKAYTELHALHA